VTRSDKKGLIAHNRKPNFFTQIQSYMNALLDFNVRHGLWLLVCFCWLLILGPLAIRTSSPEYSWCHGRPVVSCVCLSSLVVLDKDLWCWFAIIFRMFQAISGPYFFTLTPSQFISFKTLPSHRLHLHPWWGSPDTVKLQWTLVKKLSRTLLLVSCILDNIEGNIRSWFKSYAYSCFHWQATTLETVVS